MSFQSKQQQAQSQQTQQQSQQQQPQQQPTPLTIDPIQARTQQRYQQRIERMASDQQQMPERGNNGKWLKMNQPFNNNNQDNTQQELSINIPSQAPTSTISQWSDKQRRRLSGED